MLNLPTPAKSYDADNEANARRAMAEADDLNQKRNEDFVVKNNKLILTAPNGGQWSGTISNLGALTWMAL